MLRPRQGARNAGAANILLRARIVSAYVLSRSYDTALRRIDEADNIRCLLVVHELRAFVSAKHVVDEPVTSDRWRNKGNELADGSAELCSDHR